MTEYILNTEEDFLSAMKNSKPGAGDIFICSDAIFEHIKKQDWVEDSTQWIESSCKNPSNSDNVLCYCPAKDNFLAMEEWAGSNFCIGHCYNGTWRRTEDDELIAVTLWMKIPEVP